MLKTRPARITDCFSIATRLRPADLAEVRAGSGLPPATALVRGFEATEGPITGTLTNGQPVCIGGVVPEGPETGAVWMLGTTQIEEHSLSFLRQCRAQVDAWNARWPLLHNVVDERNTLHIRWLRWMGFVFVRRIPVWGAERRPFLEFGRLANV